MSSITNQIIREYATSLIIDPETRTIKIPDGFFLGVYNDKDVKIVPFVIPRFYEDNDFADFSIQINYISSSTDGNVYLVEEKTVTDNLIRFNWILGRGVFASGGTVTFIVCMRIADTSGNIVKEFNTTTHSATVLEGLEVEENLDPTAYSILANMQSLESSANQARNQAVQQAALANTYRQEIEAIANNLPAVPITPGEIDDMF